MPQTLVGLTIKLEILFFLLGIFKPPLLCQKLQQRIVRWKNELQQGEAVRITLGRFVSKINVFLPPKQNAGVSAFGWYSQVHALTLTFFFLMFLIKTRTLTYLPNNSVSYVSQMVGQYPVWDDARCWFRELSAPCPNNNTFLQAISHMIPH